MRQKFLIFSGLSLVLFLSACARQDPALFNAYGVDKGAGSVGVHTVLEGDTVYKISKNYQLPMREIITLNNIEAPYVLNTGYRMILPPPNEYEVREGDTVDLIARMYEVSPNRLASLNNIQAPYKLTKGQIIRLPAPSMDKGLVQQAVLTNNIPEAQATQSARLDSVERAPLEPRVGNNVSLNNDVMPPQPNPKIVDEPQVATVQEASVTRAKLPDDVPKMSQYSSGGKFMRPVDGKIISSYGPKADGLHNDGINIMAVKGTPVRAAENGVVVYNGDDLAGYGNLILIRHENKMMSAYAHLDKTLVERGAKVVRGQSIGTVGSTGQVDSPQLHFEIRKGSTPIDPEHYL